MRDLRFPNIKRDSSTLSRWSRSVALGFVAASLAGDLWAAPTPIPYTRELLDQFCYECHGEGVHKGDLALDKLLQQPASTDRARSWEKVWKIVRHEFMPPADADRPTEPERRKITEWIEEKMLGVDRANPDPGRVTIRRLNRMEY